MNKHYTFSMALVLVATAVSGQETPVAEAVYGGRARDFAIAINDDDTFAPTVTMYMSTESANSVFFQNGTRIAGTDPSSPIAVNDGWEVMPTLDESAGFGGTVDGLAAHGLSKSLLFIHEGTLYQTSPTATSNDLIDGLGVQDVLVVGDVVLHVRNGSASTELDLIRGSMDVDGTYTEDATLTFLSPSPGVRPKLVLNESTDELYVTFAQPVDMRVTGFGADYDAIGSSTSVFSVLDASPSDANVEWGAWDVAPDGRMFAMGNSSYELAGTGHDRQVAYSDDHGLSWTQFELNRPGPPGGVYGPDIVFVAQSDGYSVLCGDVVNHGSGEEGGWLDIGHNHVTGDTRANSGFVCVDPILPSMVYFTSNQGTGHTMDAGASTNNMCDGMLAIQVNDIDMTADKQNAWVASKSGVRRVTDYLLPTKAWSDAIWPNLDGAPYQCMEILDDNAETVIAGNTRLHKLSADGSWTTVLDPTIGAMGAAFHYGTKFKSVEQSPTNANLVMAGAIQEGTLKGGLFVSTDGGNDFMQLEMNASSTPSQDEDVLDIAFVQEGGEEVAYVALSDEDGGQGNVFRVTHDATAGSFTVAYDFDPSDCDFIGPFDNNIHDLQLSAGGDTLFAGGQNEGTGNPVLFFKELDGASNWEIMDMTSVPTTDYEGGVTALAFGNNRVFMALEEDIYYYDHGTGVWTLGYSYPEGTQIHVMYYDELLVGTGTGLYAHDVFSATTSHTQEVRVEAQAFPNPVASTLVVRTPSEGQVALLDLTGRIVVQDMGIATEAQLQVGHLPSGQYLLRWSDDDGQVLGITKVLKH
jgi:hypothetical protein